MNPVTRDFVRRWNWLLGIHFAATTIGWIIHKEGTRLHFEMLPAVAMSMDITRGLIRACLGLPITRAAIARGLWYCVAALGPVIAMIGMILALLFCTLFRMTPPQWNILSYHLVISVLLSGTMQFLLTSLPTRPGTTWPERIRDILLGLGWGLSISASLWVSFFVPAGWAGIGTGGRIVMGLLGVATVASWFTTRSMLEKRAVARPVAVSPPPGPAPRAALCGSGGWRLWLNLELGSLLPLCFMVVISMAILGFTAGLTSGGASTAVGGPANAYLTLGMIAAMTMVPLIARAAGPARVFRALPITRGRHALLLAGRPVLYCLCLFAAHTVVSVLAGRATGEEGRALCVFILIGTLFSLLQSIAVRYPRFPVAMGMGMFLAPVLVITLPLVLQSGKPVAWVAVLGLALFPVSWLLHRRWLRTSSQFYRSQAWLTRLTTGNAR